jgi:ElaB/YqjD/DUF883 family membrane-anchored ribosome-binding protein
MSPTTARRSTSSNGTGQHASKALQSLSRKASSSGRKLQTQVSRETAALSRRASQLLGTAMRSTRQHPYIAAGAVATLAALIGGALWYRQR